MDSVGQRTAIRDLVRYMMEVSGMDATALAREAGMAPSTLTRFLNQDVKHLLTARTLAKLSRASGVPVPAGGPFTNTAEDELLAVFRAADDQGREMMLRFARSLGRDLADPPPVSPTRPKGPNRSRPTAGRIERETAEVGDCVKIVRLPKVPA